MAVPFSNTKLRVPRGFQNLLEGLAREVLRSQPEELYEFGAQYFEDLIKKREESGFDPTEHGAKMEDRFYNNKAFSQPEIDPSDPSQQDAALAIQTKYRQHAAKQEVEVIREEKAATKIQAGFRGHQGRQQVDELKGESSPTRPITAGEEEVDIDLNDPDVEAAAIKIQASFKGFQTRKTMAESNANKSSPENGNSSSPQKEAEGKADQREEEEIDIDLTDPEVEKAATKIQAGFKGMKARQQVREKRDLMPMTETEPAIPLAKLEQGPEVVLMTKAKSPEMSMKCAAPEEPEEEMTMGAMCAAPEEPEEEMTMGALCAAEEPEEEMTMGAMCAAEEPEEIDIDLNDPEVEQAAIKIQAGFKGMKDRQAVKKQKNDTGLLPKTRLVDKPTMDTQGSAKSTKSEKAETEPEPATAVESVKPEAAAPLEVKLEPVAPAGSTAPEEEMTMGAMCAAPEEEEIDIDLNDPEVEAAAVKIQASFKGFKARKENSGSAKRAASAKAEEAGETATESTEAAPADKQPEPAAAEEAAQAVDEKPAATEATSAEEAPAAEQAPATTEQAPAETEQAPAADQAPAAADQPAATEEQTPAVEEPAAATEEQAPAAEEQTPAADQTPATEEQAPATEEQAPAKEEATPADTQAETNLAAEQAAAEAAKAESEKPADTAAEKPDAAPASGEAES